MFSPNYHEARTRFRTAAAKAGGELHSWEIIPPTDNESEGLTIDASVFGAGSKAIAVTSGLHGIEGFAGSAIQLDFMKRTLPEDLRVVLIHALNPYGMAHLRRVNEHNVDLNRNFLHEGETYRGSSDGYRRLNQLLNPSHATGGLEFMLTRTVWQIMRHGFNTLKTAIVGGQYDFPKGLFYGGRQLEKGPRTLLERLPALMEGVERSVLIDVHTGLGKSGTHALLVDAEAGSAQHLRLHEQYGARIQPWDADHGVAYKIRGGLPGAMTRTFGPTMDVITCEFGTHPALKVIQALRTENQQTHWGGNETHAKAVLTEAFCPVSAKWRQAVLAGGAAVIDRAITHLRA